MLPEKIIAQNILKYRYENNISQEKLANEANLSVSHIRSLEYCEHSPMVSTLEKIAKAMNINVFELLIPNTEFKPQKEKDESTEKILQLLHEAIKLIGE